VNNAHLFLQADQQQPQYQRAQDNKYQRPYPEIFHLLLRQSKAQHTLLQRQAADRQATGNE
jgi:hypothetical protein